MTSARPDDVGTGSDGALDVAQNRWSWLQGAGPREINGSFSDAGSAIHVRSTTASPVTFQTVFPSADPRTSPELQVATAPIAVADLLVAPISVGPDGQVYWADRLLG